MTLAWPKKQKNNLQARLMAVQGKIGSFVIVYSELHLNSNISSQEIIFNEKMY